MKFLCGTCRTKYQISEEKVRGKVLTIRCQKCGSKVKVREPQHALEPGEAYIAESVADETSSVGSTVKHRAVAANAGTRIPTSDLGVATFHEPDEAPTRVQVGTAKQQESASALATDVEWFTAADGKQQGPFPFTELLRRISAREAPPQHYVWNQRMDAWKRIREIPELLARVPGEAQKKSKTPPPPVPTSRSRSALDRTLSPAGQAATTSQRPSSDERALGEIVDLAEKRAELERTKRVDVASSPRLQQLFAKPEKHDDSTLQDKKSHRTPVPSARSSKADKTPVQPLPLDAILHHTTTPVATGSGHSANLDLAADLFAGLPRLQDEDSTPQRESTRFFIAAAGVHKRKQRNLVGLVLGAASFAAFALFITAWASGFVNIPIPSSVNPFTPAREQAAKEAIDDELEDDDPNDPSVRALGGPARKKRRRVKTPSGASALAQQQEKASDPHQDGDLEVIKFDPKTGESKLTDKVPEVQLPETKPSDLLPLPDSKELSAAVVNQVIAQRKSSVRICYQESLRSNERLRGKVLVEITVRPNGDVAKVNVLSKEHKSGIGGCIADRMRDWKFPSFEGHENAIVQAGFVLEKD